MGYSDDFGFVLSVLEVIEALSAGGALHRVSAGSLHALVSEASRRMYSVEALIRQGTSPPPPR